MSTVFRIMFKMIQCIVNWMSTRSRKVSCNSLLVTRSFYIGHIGVPINAILSSAFYGTRPRAKESVITRRNLILSRSHESCTSLSSPPHFSDFPLDRSGHLRKEAALLLKQEGTLIIPMHKGRPLVVSHTFSDANSLLQPYCFSDGAPVDPAGRPVSWYPAALVVRSSTAALIESHLHDDALPDSDQEGCYFLGIVQATGQAVFACSTDQPLAAAESNPCFAYVDVRSAGQQMTNKDASLLASASGLVSWHRSACFCPSTGLQMSSGAGGHVRRAFDTNSGEATRPLYPRVDPAIIVSVTASDTWLLLGRKKSWESGRYSLLAGFTELGESLEGSVVREVKEESGILVDSRSIQYHSSQPWPFPRSLMVGFMSTAVIDTGPIGLTRQGLVAAQESGITNGEVQEALSPGLPQPNVDQEELEDARWFHKDWLHATIFEDAHPDNRAIVYLDEHGQTHNENAFRIPGPYALAHTIITDVVSLLVLRAAQAPGGETDWAGSQVPQVLLVARRAVQSTSMKYVLLRLTDEKTSRSKLIVRGNETKIWHDEIRAQVLEDVRECDPLLRVAPLGGGRLELDSIQKTIHIYGFSSAFGQAVHEVAAALLKRWLPFHTVTVSYEGY